MTDALPAQRPDSLLSCLEELCSSAPRRRAYTFLRAGEEAPDEIGFGELRTRILAFAAGLQRRFEPGDRLILLYPQGLEFLVALLGCFAAGVVAVPVSVPNRKRGPSILRAVAVDCGARAILSERSLLDRVEAGLADDEVLSRVPRLTSDRLAVFDQEAPYPAEVPLCAPALIQYTSGSTGSPRGVVVTHANVLANQRQVRETCGPDPHAVGVSWLPLFHDMGLGFALSAVFSGLHCVLMDPSTFLQQPIRWLRAISDYRAQLSCAPDFAYDLCARRISPTECRGLDLSCWTMALNGSEPIRAATLERFANAFASYGFRGESYKPVYGLAEATLMVTGDAPQKTPSVRRFCVEALAQGEARPPASRSEPSRALVGCGQPRAGASVRIVNPSTLVRCPSDRIGEIWVAGPSVARGYWGQEAATRETFHAHAADGSGPYLRTGDLGFFHEGSLFVTGRLKDLIIVRGRNHYPQDIEATVSHCHPALEPLRCAAFSIDTREGEQLVVVQEVKRSALRDLNPRDAFRAITAAVSREHGLHTHCIELIFPTSLPRTTSGKVQRKPCAQAFLAGELKRVAFWGPDPSSPPDSTRLSEPDGAVSGRSEALLEWIRARSRAEGRREPPGGYERHPEASVLDELAQLGAFSLLQDPADGGLGLDAPGALKLLASVASVDFALAIYLARHNEAARRELADLATPDSLPLRLAATCAGALERCDQLARSNSPYHGRALTKKLTPNPQALGCLRATAARSIALGGLVQRIASVYCSPEAPRDELLGVCAFATVHLVAASLDDLLRLGSASWPEEAAGLERLRTSAQALLDDATLASSIERLSERLGAAPSTLNELWTCLCPEAELKPLAAVALQHVDVLLREPREAAEAERTASPTLRAQVATWTALLAATEWFRRRDDPDPELERTSAWLRSQLESGSSEVVAHLHPTPSSRPPRAWPAARPPPSAADLNCWIVNWVSRRMRVPAHDITPSRSFADYGLDSLAAVELAKALSDKLGRPLDDTLLWNFPTIGSLVAYLTESEGRVDAQATGSEPPPADEESSDDALRDEIARLEAELERRG